ncbi:hypothetical protein M422DRAFT_783897, partial [Sphaerobolus stellatus SS14]
MHPSSFARLPSPLRQLIHVQTRYASTSSSQTDHTKPPFPFPPHRNPTPHEIFHLRRGATPGEIKARYYELVRFHHPDCAAARTLPPATSHSRFQAISDAYAILSGKRQATLSASSPDADIYEEIARRKRAQWRAPAGSDEFGYGPDVWDKKDKEAIDQGMIVIIIGFVLMITIIPISLLSPFGMRYKRHNEAAKNLTEARREAREVAEVRRLALIQHTSSGKDERCGTLDGG